MAATDLSGAAGSATAGTVAVDKTRAEQINAMRMAPRYRACRPLSRRYTDLPVTAGLQVVALGALVIPPLRTISTRSRWTRAWLTEHEARLDAHAMDQSAARR